MTLTRPQMSKLIRLLGVLQSELEVVITSHDPPGTADEKRWVSHARRQWREAENLVADLDRARRKLRGRK